MWTPVEAEQILREQWTGSESVGGFDTPHHAYMVRNELEQEIAVPSNYRLIGHTHWCDYEEGGETFLFLREEDQTLWTFDRGSTVYGNHGEEWLPEVAIISEWLEHVFQNIEHMENFQGI